MYSCPECEQPINQASEVAPLRRRPKSSGRHRILLAGKTPKPTKTNYKRVALVCGILLATLWAIAWFAVPWKLSGSKTKAEARARESLAVIQQAINAYQQTEGSVPPSLETLGDSVRKAAQSAQLVHYTVQYSPGGTRPRRSRHRLHSHSPRRKFRLPQFLRRRIRSRALHHRRSLRDSARPCPKSSTVNSLRQDSKRSALHNFLCH